MAKPYSALENEMPPAVRQKGEERFCLLDQEVLGLAELRKARLLSQEQLAESMTTRQANISKLESRVDIYISTLRRYIEAMGGNLDIVASFADGQKIRIQKFSRL